MNFVVHLLMAHSIRKNVKKTTGQNLHLAGFFIGNILPDLATRFDQFPHYMDQSLDYICDAAAVLSEMSTARNFAYSKNMGIITHYISDYFCYPHTHLFSGGLLKHMLYELRMTLSFFKGRKLAVPQAGGVHDPEFIASSEVADNVRSMAGAYCRLRSHSRHDIAYAIQSCSAVAAGVLCESTMYDSLTLAQSVKA